MAADAEAASPVVEAAEEPAPKGYVVGQSITSRFHYEAVPNITATELAQHDASQNCVVRSLISGAAGGVMGIAFGIFMGAMDPAAMGNPAPLADQPSKTTMQVLRSTYRMTKERSVMYARSFATLGMLYAGIECVIESHRGKHDMYNSLYTGFVTGGLLARGSGPMGMAMGAASFAGFSVAVDRFMGFH